ncbi:MAG: hypothetical protein UR26_C0003G0150 [candidate division TM6 bacterium GW2011_GWF2_32_72]|nr:MAG: hypothetical protein UR26_C0003G0150 [candidate division TM6 bacterium GW2011_GWF2_32_72]
MTILQSWKESIQYLYQWSKIKEFWAEFFMNLRKVVFYGWWWLLLAWYFFGSHAIGSGLSEIRLWLQSFILFYLFFLISDVVIHRSWNWNIKNQFFNFLKIVIGFFCLEYVSSFFKIYGSGDGYYMAVIFFLPIILLFLFLWCDLHFFQFKEFLKKFVILFPYSLMVIFFSTVFSILISIICLLVFMPDSGMGLGFVGLYAFASTYPIVLSVYCITFYRLQIVLKK